MAAAVALMLRYSIRVLKNKNKIQKLDHITLENLRKNTEVKSSHIYFYSALYNTDCVKTASDKQENSRINYWNLTED